MPSAVSPIFRAASASGDKAFKKYISILRKEMIRRLFRRMSIEMSFARLPSARLILHFAT